MDLWIAYNKLFCDFTNHTVLFYNYKIYISDFFYKFNNRNNKDYHNADSIKVFCSIINQFNQNLKSFSTDTTSLTLFKKCYLQKPHKLPLMKLIGSHVNKNQYYIDYVNIIKSSLSNEKKLYLHLKQINNLITECEIYINFIQNKIKPFMNSIKTIQKHWDISRYNPEYALCKHMFVKYFPK